MKFDDIEKLSLKKEASLEKKVINEYREALKDVRVMISDVFEKYEQGGVLTISEMHKYNRLLQLEKALYDRVSKVYVNTKKTMGKDLGELYGDVYYQNMFLLEQTADQKLFTTPLDDNLVTASVQNNLTGLTLNERLEHNRTLVVNSIKQTITQGLVAGVTYKEMMGNITKIVEGDASKASRIVRTEAHRNQNAAHLQAYKQAESKGIKMKKRWVSTLDSRTRKDHQKLDGQVVGMDEMFKIGRYEADAPGHFGVASEDINCRCRIVTFFEDQELETRIARNQFGGNETISYKNYDEWHKDRVQPKKEKEKPLTKTEQMRKDLADMKAKTEQARKELEESTRKKEEAKAKAEQLRVKEEKQTKEKEALKKRVDELEKQLKKKRKR